jgi:hypothetical protein
MTDNYDDAVGYGRPPKHSQFQPGQSGNPNGRPKDRRNLKTELEEELGERILVREGEKQQRITKRHAVIKGQLAKAIKGDTRAAAWVFELFARLLDDSDSGRMGTGRQLAATDQAILDDYAARLAKQQEPGDALCEPLDKEGDTEDE